MRLTTKDSIMGRKHDIKCGVASVWKTKLKNSRYELIEEAVDKLGELEDIEEELDIDLIVFSKLLLALDKGSVYVKVRRTKQYDGYSAIEETGEIRETVITRFSRCINGARDWFFTISYGGASTVSRYLLNDYGKTWALTREELETQEEN